MQAGPPYALKSYKHGTIASSSAYWQHKIKAAIMKWSRAAASLSLVYFSNNLIFLWKFPTTESKNHYLIAEHSIIQIVSSFYVHSALLKWLKFQWNFPKSAKEECAIGCPSGLRASNLVVFIIHMLPLRPWSKITWSSGNSPHRRANHPGVITCFTAIRGSNRPVIALTYIAICNS